MLVAAGGVLAGIAVFLVVLAVTGPKSTEQARQARFTVGSAERLAPTVDRQGPLLFQDLRGGSRDIYVQHVSGGDWRAFEARAPGAPRRCTLRWEAAARYFVDPCSGRTYPPDGTGLIQYPALVDKQGALVVDLSSGPAPTTGLAPVQG